MKINLFSLLYILIIFSCCNEKVEKHYFNGYNSQNNLMSRDTFIILKDRESHIVKILNYSNTELYRYFEEEKDSGIFRAIDLRYEKTHHFDTVFKYFTNLLPEKEPFINKDVRFNGKQKYTINNNTLDVYSFSEFNNEAGDIWSYYLSNFGFICYYYKNSDSYIYCDSSINNLISTDNLKSLRKLLVSDTFFLQDIHTII